MAVARERGTTVLTIGDVERLGIERAAEAALEIASRNTRSILLSLDIDVVDPGNAPGLASPSPEGCRHGRCCGDDRMRWMKLMTAASRRVDSVVQLGR
jgi:arginase family enzyme